MERLYIVHSTYQGSYSHHVVVATSEASAVDLVNDRLYGGTRYATDAQDLADYHRTLTEALMKSPSTLMAEFEAECSEENGETEDDNNGFCPECGYYTRECLCTRDGGAR